MYAWMHLTLGTVPGLNCYPRALAAFYEASRLCSFGAGRVVCSRGVRLLFCNGASSASVGFVCSAMVRRLRIAGKNLWYVVNPGGVEVPWKIGLTHCLDWKTVGGELGFH